LNVQAEAFRIKTKKGVRAMPKTLTLRIDDKTYKTFMRLARAENRSLANFIETAVKAHIRESAFVDDSEMAEILANEQLVERLKRGSRDARRKKGTLIG
jgi:predicted transcriptional regulator